MKKYLVLILITVFAQTLTAQWAALYSNMGGDYSGAIIVNNNSVYIAGYTWTGVNTENNGLLIKYNYSGDTSWIRQYDGSIQGEDFFYSAALDNQGNIVVAGESESTTNYDFLTAKYNSNGNLLWSALYNGNANGVDEAIGVDTDDSSNIYITGHSQQTSSYTIFTTIKYNSSGNLKWIRNYFGDSLSNNTPKNIQVAKATGNVYITGLIFGAAAGADLVALKYDRLGNLQWVKRINGPVNLNDEGLSLALDADENIYVAGDETVTVNGNTQFITCKINAGGNILWTRYYSGAAGGANIAKSVVVDPQGNCYVTGSSYLNSAGINREIVTISYDSSGNQRWLAHYNNNGHCCDHVPCKITIDAAGNLFVCAYSGGSLNNYHDFVIIKYNEQSGSESAVCRYHFNGSSNDDPYTLAVDSLGNCFVTGYVANNSDINIGTIMILPNAFGIKKISENVPEYFTLFQNYPNPFNPSTKIKFDLPVPQAGLPKSNFNPGETNARNIKLIIYDAAGKEVAVLFRGELKPGSYELEWNALNYPSGVYFYELKSEDFSQTRKLVLIK